ncbi:mCG147298 [Mus musculus]|nr:mCG147298 [Mus musculus]
MCHRCPHSPLLHWHISVREKKLSSSALLREAIRAHH